MDDWLDEYRYYAELFEELGAEPPVADRNLSKTRVLLIVGVLMVAWLFAIEITISSLLFTAMTVFAIWVLVDSVVDQGGRYD